MIVLALVRMADRHPVLDPVALRLDARHLLGGPRLPALLVQVRAPLARIEGQPVEVGLAVALGGPVQAFIRFLTAQLAVSVEQRAGLPLAQVVLAVLHVAHGAFGLRHTAGIAGLDHRDGSCACHGLPSPTEHATRLAGLLLGVLQVADGDDQLAGQSHDLVPQLPHAALGQLLLAFQGFDTPHQGADHP